MVASIRKWVLVVLKSLDFYFKVRYLFNPEFRSHGVVDFICGVTTMYRSNNEKPKSVVQDIAKNYSIFIVYLAFKGLEWYISPQIQFKIPYFKIGILLEEHRPKAFLKDQFIDLKVNPSKKS